MSDVDLSFMPQAAIDAIIEQYRENLVAQEFTDLSFNQEFLESVESASYDLSRINETPKRKTVGVKDPRLVVRAKNASGTAVTLTQTTFDTTTRPGFAEILLTNSTGASADLIGLAVVGKRIVQVGGKNGFVHDYFIDEQSIERDGERKFELANGFIANKKHVESLADYWWKNSRTDKHAYSVSITGTRFDLTPGERYTLTITVEKNGVFESIDSTVECYSVDIEKEAGQPGVTNLVFREIEETWAKTAIANARFAVGGNAQRKLSRVTTLTVGASTFTDETNFVCDGTADDVQIQKAIDILAGKGGGTVLLSPGDYTVSAVLTVKSSVTLLGTAQESTTLKLDSSARVVVNDNAVLSQVKLERTAGTLQLCNFSNRSVLTNIIADPGSGAGFLSSSANDVVLSNIRFTQFKSNDAIRLALGSDRAFISNIEIDGNSQTGDIDSAIIISGDDCQISSVIIKDFTANASSVTLAGIYLFGDRNQIANVRIDNITSSVSSIARGLRVSGSNNSVANVVVTNVDNSHTAANSEGIRISGDETNITNVKVQGCSGTGVLIHTSADRTSLSNGRTTGNGTDYTDNGTNTKRDTTTFEIT